jgi:hypothetical protein
MQVTEFMNQTYYAYRGKGASKTPLAGSEKYATALAIANRKIKEWATDPNNKWASLFEVRTVDTVDATTPTYTYDLPTDFYASSDFAEIIKTDGSRVEYPITLPQKRNLYNQALYISGRNPKKITFANTIDTGLNGGDLNVAAYYIPADLVNSTDVIPVDSPEWLIYATAAELARNDAAKDDQFPNLAGIANDLYRKMVEANNMAGFLQDNTVTNNMPVIGEGTTDDWTRGE